MHVAFTTSNPSGVTHAMYQFDIDYIKKAIELAKLGTGKTSPNPLVGAVIVKDNKIIGEGYHERYGAPHAEAVAIQRAAGNTLGATLYVNLEPCNHYGLTPPCTEAIINAGIKRVVISMVDPNPLVHGKGIQRLLSAGIEVVTGVYEEQALWLNRGYVKRIKTGMPWVILKAAITLDGMVADVEGNSKWITNQPARREVHMLRKSVDGIIVGWKTVNQDDPSLDVRLVESDHTPRPVILDTHLRVRSDAKVLSRHPLIFTRNPNRIKLKKPVELININPHNLHAVLKALGDKGMNMVMVEGGSESFSSFLRAGCVDEIYLFIAPKLLGAGLLWTRKLGPLKISTPLHLQIVEVKAVGSDIMLRLLPPQSYFNPLRA